MPKINRAPVSAPRAAIENVGLGIPLANMATGALESLQAPAWLTDNAGALVVVLVALLMHVARDRGWLPGGILSGIAKTGVVALLAVTLSGCTGVVGTVTPRDFTIRDTTGQGALVVACEIKGFAWGGGDGGICRVDDDGYVNTVEGGRASEMARDILGSLTDGAARIFGGIFGGIGAALSSIGDAAQSE